MGFYFHRIPSFIKTSFSNHIWDRPCSEKKIYLTFDDGPTPEGADFILDVLTERKALATFFCLGEQVSKYPELVKKIDEQGHLLANHGYRHLDGWTVSKKVYLDNKNKGDLELSQVIEGEQRLFRAPYGHFRKGESTVMWSLMSGDFDNNLSKEKCLSLLTSMTRSGDIIVFHDNKISFEKMKWVLPRYLEYCVRKGFQFDLITMNK